MKKYLFFLSILGVLSFSFSCNRKTGCPAMNQEAALNKKGNLKKPAQTMLFSKKSKIKYYRNTNTKGI